MLTKDTVVKITLNRPHSEVADLRRAAILTRIPVTTLIGILSQREKFETKEYIVELIKE